MSQHRGRTITDLEALVERALEQVSDIHDAPLGEHPEAPFTPTVIAGEVAQYHPAPECKGVIAARESLEPEGPMGAASSMFRGAQNGLTAGETAGIQPTPEARAESFREFRVWLDEAFELPIEVLISNANRRLLNMVANGIAKEVIDTEISRLMELLKEQGEFQA